MSRVLITGSNRGLGLEFAKEFAEDNYEVIATCRNLKSCTDLNALSKTSSVLGTVTLAASPTKKEAPLMSLEDLEFSIGMGSDCEDEEEEEEDVGDVGVGEDVKGLQEIVEDGKIEVDDGWTLCESWQSCPIGSDIPFN